MKSVLSAILCFLLVLTFFSGCKPKEENVVSAKDNVKRIHFTERFDETIFEKFSNPFAPVLNSNNEGFSYTDCLFKWAEFTDISAVTPLFYSTIDKMIDEFNLSIQAIKKAKENVILFDKWVEIENEKFLVCVNENSETVFTSDKDGYRICKRNLNTELHEKYEIFSSSGKGENKKQQRILYIQDIYYEYSFSLANETISLVADNSKGYLNIFLVKNSEGTISQFNLIKTDNACYVIENGNLIEEVDAESSDSEITDKPKNNIFSLRILSSDGKNDLLKIASSGGRVLLYLNALKGFDYVSALANEEEIGKINEDKPMIFLDNGVFVTGTTSISVSLSNGNVIKAGDSFSGGQLVCVDGKVDYNEGYGAYLNLIVGGNTYKGKLNNIKNFLGETGLKFGFDFDKIVEEINNIGIVVENYFSLYKWNDCSINELDEIKSGFYEEGIKFKRAEIEYSDSLMFDDVDMYSYVNKIENPSIAELLEVEAEAKITDDNKLFVKLSGYIENLSLIDEHGEYKFVVALAKKNITNDDYDCFIPLTPKNARSEKYSGEKKFSFSRDFEYTLKEPTVFGDYTIVFYLATDDNIRVSDVKVLHFTEELPQKYYEKDGNISYEFDMDSGILISVYDTSDIFVYPDKKKEYSPEEIRNILFGEIFKKGIPLDLDLLYYDVKEKEWLKAEDNQKGTVCRIPFEIKGEKENRIVYAYFDMTK